MFSIFKSPEFLLFKQSLAHYCKTNNYHHLELSDQEITQLSWLKNNQGVTPEARNRKSEQFHFEIERSLARVYSLELLRRGDQKAYQEFVQSQDPLHRLSFESFKSLANEVQQFTKDQYTLIRATCFLSMSEVATNVLNHAGLNLSTDSEEFLSQFAEKARTHYLLLPVTSTLSKDQQDALIKIYWPHMHFRHLYYTEGGDNMTKTFVDGVRTHVFKEADFVLWRWRWLTNLFGFQGGKGAKYYDEEVHQLSEKVFASLRQIFDDPQYPVLTHYLHDRAESFGFYEKTKILEAVRFLSHIGCCFHQPKIATARLGELIFEGYQRFLNASNGEIAHHYEDYVKNPHLITPTYMPAVLNNAYLIFKNKFSFNEEESIRQATHFFCDLQDALFKLPSQQRISYMTMAKEANLLPILSLWQKDTHAIQFLMNANGECFVEERVNNVKRNSR